MIPGPESIPIRCSRGPFAAAAALILLSCACGRKEQNIELDRSFSYNVIRVPSWYPGEETVLSPTEQEILDRRGHPEFFRLWWNTDGKFVTSSDLYQQFKEMPELMQTVKKTWVFLKEGKEVEFKPTGEYVEHPVADKLRLICLFGDPSEKSPPRPDSRGREREVWIWIDRGIKIELLDGAEVKRDYFNGSGRGTYLNK